DADRSCRYIDPPQLEAAEDMVQPASLNAADQAIGWDLVVIEAEFAGVEALVSELLELAADREPGPLLGDQQAHAPVSRLCVRIGLDQEREAVPLHTVGNPGLAAIDDVLVAWASGDGSDRLEVSAAIGLRQSDTPAELAGGKPRKKLGLLLLRAVSLHHHRHDEMRVDNAADRHPYRGHPLDYFRVGAGRKAKPAVFRSNDTAEQTHLLHFLDDLGRIDAVV